MSERCWLSRLEVPHPMFFEYQTHLQDPKIDSILASKLKTQNLTQKPPLVCSTQEFSAVAQKNIKKRKNLTNSPTHPTSLLLDLLDRSHAVSFEVIQLHALRTHRLLQDLPLSLSRARLGVWFRGKSPRKRVDNEGSRIYMDLYVFFSYFFGIS